MNTNRTRELDSFESALLSELKGVVAERASSPSELTTGRYAAGLGRRARPVRWVAASVVALAAAGFGVATLGGTAAYAVTTDDDGSVTVTINRLEGADALEAELAAHGVTADVTYTPSGTMCQDGRYATAEPKGFPMSASATKDGVFSLTIPKGVLTSGQTLVLESMWPNEHSWSLKTGIASGAVADCVPVPFAVPDGAVTQVDGDSSGGGTDSGGPGLQAHTS